MPEKKRIVIGISGASGTPVAVELLKALRDMPKIETHLVISHGGQMTLEQESGYTLAQVEALADIAHDNKNIGATIASGSFKTAGMIICPCSMKTLAAVNHGYSEGLMQRAADVTVKERRRLLLVPRECPLSPIHLKNMYELSVLGAVILPPVVSYYNKPETALDMTRHIVGKILDAFGLEYEHFVRWEGMDALKYK